MTKIHMFWWSLLFAAMFIMACSSDNTSGTTGTDVDTDTDTDSDSDGDSDNTGDTDTQTFDECTAISEGAENTRQPADIIIAIDNSPSLEDEIAEVRANMNAFSQQIIDSGIDLRIALISCLEGDCVNESSSQDFYGICIDPPLGDADGCQGDPELGPVSDDTNLPTYKHIKTRVPSAKGLQWIVETYENDNLHSPDGWKDMIRDDSVKYFVVVSDDAEEWSATTFNDALVALDPVRLSDYYFSGIFSYMYKEEACAISEDEPCCEYAAPLTEGLDWDAYSDLVALTGGVSGDLCLQDFDPVFESLGTAVIASSKINCEWEIPVPPEGEELDPNMLNVNFIYDELNHYIGRVDSVDMCDSVEHGWYYDDPVNPTMIYVCPQTCEWFQGIAGASLTIEFGCMTEEAIVE